MNVRADAAIELGPQTPRGPMDFARLVMRCNLHPEDDMHVSWLPRDWPPPHRCVKRLGAAGRTVLADVRRQWVGEPLPADFNFDSQTRRIALLAAPDLRRLAIYCGLCAHKHVLRKRPVSTHLRRQLRGLDDDAIGFVSTRAPTLSELSMNCDVLFQQPRAAGRIVLSRGYRLLLALVASEGEFVLRQVRHKLPRRVALMSLPPLNERQRDQLKELITLCIIPERLPQWDWLF